MHDGSGPRESGSNERDSDGDRRGRIHAIELVELLIHKNPDQSAVLQDADILARTVFKKELRDGETYKKTGPTSYRLIFPKLKPEAGQLRCAVIRDMIARELRRLEPEQAEYSNGKKSSSAPRSASASGNGSGPSSNGSSLQQEHKVAATRAFALMAAKQNSPSEDATLTAGDKAALAAFELIYHPVWHAKNNVIAAYQCRLAQNGVDVALNDVRACLSGTTVDILNAKIDAFVYGAATRAIQFLNAQGLKALLILPIHFSTIDRLRFASQILELSAALPPESKNLLVFEIRDLPRDASRFRLREPVSYVRNRARALVAELDFEPRDLDALKECGFHGVSVSASQFGKDETQLFKELERFAAAAEKYRLQSFVHGVPSRSLSTVAIGAGFTYIDGVVISPPVANPNHIRPFEIDMLYSM